MDEGDADTDVDPDEEMEFNSPGFVVIDKSDVEFTMNLIGRWVGYKFVNDSQVPDGWWRAKVDKVAKVDAKKGFTHALTFQKIHDTGQIWATCRAKGTKIPAELKEEGYGTERGGRWVLLDSAPN